MRVRTVLAVAALAAAAAVSALPADTTRTLRMDLPQDVRGAFAVENLAGTMHVVAGSPDRVTATVTVHADDEDAAAAVQLVMSTSEEGYPSLRVRYPLEKYGSIRYPGVRKEEGVGSLLSGLFGGSNTTTKYDDHKVRISTSSGTLLYADVEVQVPRRALEATFRNLVGKLSAEEVEGKLKFDASSGDIVLDRVKGTILADTGSGDVKATDLGGSFKCDTGSGDCALSGFDGDKIECDVGSGDVTLRSATARLVTADTGSGDVRVEAIDASEFVADTGSGDIEMEAKGGRLTRVKADTGSGNVHLRLDPDASFEARADQGSGDIRNLFKDAQPIVKNKEVVGYRRGDGRIRIDVETGSGDLVLEPTR